MTVLEDRIESNLDTCTMLAYTETDNRAKFLIGFLVQTLGCKVSGDMYRAGRKVFEENIRQAGFRVRNYDDTRESREVIHYTRPLKRVREPYGSYSDL